MRYKFRGKRVDKGEWVYGNLIEDDNGNMFIVKEGEISPCILPSMYLDEVYEIIPETVGQRTSFKDLSLKEIWEGDVFHIESSDDLGVVVFLSGCWLVKWERLNGKPVAGDFSRLCDVKYLGYVIGNVHDNPELLKGGKNDKV